MKKIVQVLLIFFAAMPLLFRAQGQLVKWYHGDFSPSLTEQHISSVPLTAAGGVQKSNETWGDQNVFYSFSGWPAPVWNQTAEERFDDKKYVQFTVKPDAGYQLQMEKFTFSARMQGSTGSMRVRFSKDNFSTYTDMPPQPVVVTSTYATYSLSFPDNTVVNSDKDETLYVRVYVYNTNNNFHIKHDLTGQDAPVLWGSVVSESLIPQAVDDVYRTTVNNSVVVPVLYNDRYSNLNSIAITSAPAHGTVKVNGVTDVTYTPAYGYSGTDVFKYTLTNAHGTSNETSVVMKVDAASEQALVRWEGAVQNNIKAPTLYRNGSASATVPGLVSKDFSLGSALNLEGMWENKFGVKNWKDVGNSKNDRYYVDYEIGAQDGFQLALSKFVFSTVSWFNSPQQYRVYSSKSGSFSGEELLLGSGVVSGSESVATHEVSLSNMIVYPGETLKVRVYLFALQNNWDSGVYIGAGSTNGTAFYGDVQNVIHCGQEVSWDGSRWSTGAEPTSYQALVVKGNLDINKDLTVCSCQVDGGAITVKSGKTLTVKGNITNTTNKGSNFIVEDGANLIQTDNAAVNTGNIEVQKVFTFSAGRQQYNYVSSPTVGTNVKSIYAGILDNSLEALYHNENTNYFGISAGTYIAGRALALKEPSTGVAGGSATNPSKFRGVPFNGILNYPLAYTTNRPNVNHGYNLVGNPYPSNLDLVALYNYLDNQKRIESTILFWDNRGNTKTAQEGSIYNGNSYAKFNVLNQTGIGTDPTLPSGAVSSRIPTRYVSPGQGFMVRAKSDANGKTLQFSNGTMRVSDAATQFFGRGATAGEMDRYWLSFTAPTDISVSTAVVYFEGGATTFGQDDSEASNSSDNLYTIADAHNISIHGRPVFTSDDIVPLGYSSFKAGNATISILDAEGTFHNGQSIYLKDKILNTITDLTQGDYTFETQKGTFTNRFEIVYKPQTILATDQTKSSSVMVYRDAADFVVQSSGKKIDWVEVYDMSGRLYKTIKGGDKTVRFSAQEMAQGMYVLKIVREGEVSSKRILK